jgi:hypothetical protein
MYYKDLPWNWNKYTVYIPKQVINWGNLAYVAQRKDQLVAQVSDDPYNYVADLNPAVGCRDLTFVGDRINRGPLNVVARVRQP